ncbi:TPA: hypothetical protein ACRMK9_000133 [Pseudomonas aeruginosa]|uniref:hypothetical protein n=1 Tax=Pseudomonas aeruginosa TaxID=287 RepID=UPI001CD60D57|nr:hypothetical protein [Pseudomonas aeruginosa]MBX6863068.1 hypothetical protein [Pseudomonas aeruginosa]MCZ9751517.1 hypothetical protein [Pseudomonas aeruginosa]
MDMNRPWTSGVVRFWLLLMVGISVSACAMLFDSGNSDWEEEVLLSDGRVIVVERETIYVPGGDEYVFNRSGIKADEYRIRFSDPGGSERVIEWRSTKKSPQTYPEVPLVFDLISGRPVVFTLIDTSICCEVYSKYVYQNGRWIEEGLPEKFEVHKTNLLFGSEKDLPKLVTIKERIKRNDGARYRKSLEQVGPDREVKFH